MLQLDALTALLFIISHHGTRVIMAEGVAN